MFVLEAVKAKHGDCLLLHWGPEAAPRLALIDGGPGGIYRRFLRPRLAALAQERGVDRLAIDLAMVSHIDEDHISGLIDLAEEMELRAAPATIGRLWHNSLEGLLDTPLDSSEVDRATAALGGPSRRADSIWYAKVLASVRQGQILHGHARRLGLAGTMNHPFQPLVAARAGARPARLGGLSLTVIGPALPEIEALRAAWREKRVDGIVAAFADDSPYNLSSIVVLAAYRGRRMLLTGDARGDRILDGLKRRRLLRDGRIHVDLLKLPHHGSPNNVTPEFFEQVTADAYVVSGDGRKHPNPHRSAMTWLADARAGGGYEVYCTYDLPHMRRIFGRRLKLPADGAASVAVSL